MDSFKSGSPNECLHERWFLWLTDARAKIQRWRQEYTGFRPHSYLPNLTPDAVKIAFYLPVFLLPTSLTNERILMSSKKPSL
ncbi:integrase core domain-containing protein [Hymenobacter arcticus]